MTDEEIVARVFARQDEHRRQVFEQVAEASRAEREAAADLWTMLHGSEEDRQAIRDRLLRRPEENRNDPTDTTPDTKPDA